MFRLNGIGFGVLYCKLIYVNLYSCAMVLCIIYKHVSSIGKRKKSNGVASNGESKRVTKSDSVGKAKE